MIIIGNRSSPTPWAYQKAKRVGRRKNISWLDIQITKGRIELVTTNCQGFCIILHVGHIRGILDLINSLESIMESQNGACKFGPNARALESD